MNRVLAIARRLVRKVKATRYRGPMKAVGESAFLKKIPMKYSFDIRNGRIVYVFIGKAIAIDRAMRHLGIRRR